MTDTDKNIGISALPAAVFDLIVMLSTYKELRKEWDVFLSDFPGVKDNITPSKVDFGFHFQWCGQLSLFIIALMGGIIHCG